MNRKYIFGLILLVAIIGAVTYTVTVSRTDVTQDLPVLPTTCINDPQSEGTPVITSLSAYSGSIGDTIEIRGCNVLGFEGDRTAWIENEAGTKGILYGTQDSTAGLIRIVLRTPLCQTDNSYSGLPCDAELDLVPGRYLLYTLPWGKQSNKVPFTLR